MQNGDITQKFQYWHFPILAEAWLGLPITLEVILLRAKQKQSCIASVLHSHTICPSAHFLAHHGILPPTMIKRSSRALWNQEIAICSASLTLQNINSYHR